MSRWSTARIIVVTILVVVTALVVIAVVRGQHVKVQSPVKTGTTTAAGARVVTPPGLCIDWASIGGVTNCLKVSR